MHVIAGRACERNVSGVGRNPTGAVNGVQKIKWSVSGRSREWEQSGDQAKSADQNPLHHKTTQSKKFKIKFKSYHKIVSVSSLLPSSLCRE